MSLDGGDRVNRRHDGLIVVTRITRDVEGNQRRPAAHQARAAEWRLDVGGGLRQRPQRRHDLPDRLVDLRVVPVGLARRATLDEHALAVGLLDDGPVQHPFGLPRLPGVVAVDVGGADFLTDDYGRDDQQQPAEDSGLAMSNGPSGHSFHDGGTCGLLLIHATRLGDRYSAGPWCDLPKAGWG
jgi:hypothetical protein